MKKIIKVLGSCFLLAMLAVGCAEDGEPGPPGDQGEQGVQGEQGEKGDPGTANVVYSQWLKNNFTGDIGYEEYQLVEIDTNQYSLNTTVFLLYAKTTNGVVQQLPLQINTTTYSYYVLPDFGTGSPARIMVYRDGNTPSGSRVPADFRYIIIPGGVRASGRIGQPEFDDYEEVRKFYKIPN